MAAFAREELAEGDSPIELPTAGNPAVAFVGHHSGGVPWPLSARGAGEEGAVNPTRPVRRVFRGKKKPRAECGAVPSGCSLLRPRKSPGQGRHGA
jgi:hypothetical protein